MKPRFFGRLRALSQPTDRLQIVVRQSPDWRDTPYEDLLENSRSFCRMIAAPVGLQENFISDIVAVWDRIFKMPFFQVRAAMKDIAEKNLARVKRASVTAVEHAEPSAIRAEPLYLFIDDDDWLRPDIYAAMKPYLSPKADGYTFGNILCVSHIELRAIENGCYTNNYAVSGRFLQQGGGDIACVTQHWTAHQTFNEPGFRVAQIPLYLSATNKHPASTMKLKDGLAENALSAATLRRLIEKYVDESSHATTPLEADWTKPYTKKVRTVFAALL